MFPVILDCGKRLEGLVLGDQPSQIGAVDDAGRVADAPDGAANLATDQPLDREERHLGVVGDEPDAAVGSIERRDPLRRSGMRSP